MEALFFAASILFQRLYTQPGEVCPEGIERVGFSESAECATYEHGLERLKKTLEQYDDRPSRKVTTERDSGGGLPPSKHTAWVFKFQKTWRKQGNLYFRDWLEDDRLRVIAYDPEAGLLAVMYKDSCLEPDVRAREDLYFGGGPDFIRAEAKSRSLPSNPRSSPGHQKEGVAVVQFVVGRDGDIGAACVLHTRPGGFGKRALKAIREWEFIPATLEDRPVDSVVSYAFRWRNREWTYERHVRRLPD